MSVKPRTIDNLGIDSSVRYAKDKESLDLRLVQESNWLPKRLEVAVVKPYVPSDFDELFSLNRTVQWAFFDAPPGYGTQAKTLFSYQLVPSLGSYEKQEADTEKLTFMKDAIFKQKKKSSKQKNDQDEEEEEEENERQTLLTLFKCIEKLDRTLNLINLRRNQYQKG